MDKAINLRLGKSKCTLPNYNCVRLNVAHSVVNCSNNHDQVGTCKWALRVFHMRYQHKPNGEYLDGNSWPRSSPHPSKTRRIQQVKNINVPEKVV